MSRVTFNSSQSNLTFWLYVVQLEQVGSNYDVEILLDAWCGNRHAGGEEFQSQLNNFLRLMGQRPCACLNNML